MRIGIIGAGAWGTALGIALGRNGRHEIKLWAYETEVVEAVQRHQENKVFLPGFKLPPTIEVTPDLGSALKGAQIVVSVMPSHHCRRVFTSMSPHLNGDMLFVSATKGLENETMLRMSEVISDVVPKSRGFGPRVGALSGPSFAKEVAKGDPTAITVASGDPDLAACVQREFSDHTFRIYTSDDVVGVELGGALKNVIAIAAGICEGLDLGHNTAAALITRGLAEITRLAVTCGAKPQTLAGLAGMGDLVLTCTGGLSRNRAVGVELGRGRALDDIVSGMHGTVAEGVLTTNAAVGLARQKKIEMPITGQMFAILHDGKSPREAIRELMTRPGKVE